MKIGSINGPFLLVTISLAIFNCAPPPKNTLEKQFLDVDETLLLVPNMKKNTVIQYLGTDRLRGRVGRGTAKKHACYF